MNIDNPPTFILSQNKVQNVLYLAFIKRSIGSLSESIVSEYCQLHDTFTSNIPRSICILNNGILIITIVFFNIMLNFLITFPGNSTSIEPPASKRKASFPVVLIDKESSKDYPCLVFIVVVVCVIETISMCFCLYCFNSKTLTLTPMQSEILLCFCFAALLLCALYPFFSFCF